MARGVDGDGAGPIGDMVAGIAVDASENCVGGTFCLLPRGKDVVILLVKGNSELC